MRLPIALAVMMLVVDIPAVAAEPVAAGQTAGEPQKVKKICRNTPPRTGTRRPQGRICKTAEEWRALDRDVYTEGRFEHHNDFRPDKRNAGLPE